MLILSITNSVHQLETVRRPVGKVPNILNRKIRPRICEDDSLSPFLWLKLMEKYQNFACSTQQDCIVETKKAVYPLPYDIHFDLALCG